MVALLDWYFISAFCSGESGQNISNTELKVSHEVEFNGFNVCSKMVMEAVIRFKIDKSLEINDFHCSVLNEIGIMH